MTNEQKKEKILKEIEEKKKKLDKLIEVENEIKLFNLIGNCYKFKNCYSCPESEEDYWWLYIKCYSKVDDVEESYLVNCLSFEKDKYGNLFLRREQKDIGNFDSNYHNYILISNQEYLREFLKFKNELTTIETLLI